MEEDPEQVAIIKKIFEFVLEGKTLYYVSKYLYDREIKINNGYPFVSLISRLLHNELYIGIRKRTSKFGREEGKEDVVIQHIAPIISEDDFYRDPPFGNRSSQEGQFHYQRGAAGTCGDPQMLHGVLGRIPSHQRGDHYKGRR